MTTAATRPTANRNTIDPVAILREEAIAAAVAHGAERCEELAESLVMRYVNRVGGLRHYVRQSKAVERESIHRQIRQRFNGTNLEQLALEFHRSPRHLRRILASEK